MSRPSRKSVLPPTPQTTRTGLRPERAEVDELVRKISELVSESPDRASKILEQWLREPARPETRKKSG